MHVVHRHSNIARNDKADEMAKQAIGGLAVGHIPALLS
jgi:hypothetical protein